jgi:hypothetical protein
VRLFSNDPHVNSCSYWLLTVTCNITINGLTETIMQRNLLLGVKQTDEAGIRRRLVTDYGVGMSWKFEEETLLVHVFNLLKPSSNFT